MAEGTGSSTGVVLSGSNGRSFDVQSWQGLSAVLQAGRDAEMTPEDYAAFRDDVMAYAGSGGTDDALRAKIEEKIGATSAPVKKEKKPAQSGFGHARPAPSFGSGTSVPVRSVEPKQPAPKKEEPEESPAPQPAAKTPPQPVQRKEPTPAPSAPPPADQPIKTVSQYRDRIMEIKRTVNAEIGNPMAVMDGDNQIGREYMRALLAAMKAVNGGAPGTLTESMQELEESFSKLLRSPRDQREEVPAPEPEPAPEPAPAPEVPPEPAETEVQKEPVQIPESPKNEELPASAIPSLADEEPEVPPTPASAPAPKPVTPAPQKEDGKPSLLEKLMEEKTRRTRGEGTPAEKKEAQSPAEKAPAPESPKKKSTVPIAEDAIAAAKKQSPLPPGAVDDLHTPEITAGLQQLLNDWSIFRGSGFFGMGPTGIENPLWEKLSKMPMASVVSGEWDNADREVLLSIRDYTNGWRHEQGIAYVPGETFEHYLRRVVQRILKRQNR